MPVVYSHKRPPVCHGAGEWDCCPAIQFPQGIPDTVAEPIDDDGFSMLVPATTGEGTVTERVHAALARRIAAAAQSRGFYEITAADIPLPLP